MAGSHVAKVLIGRRTWRDFESQLQRSGDSPAAFATTHVTMTYAPLLIALSLALAATPVRAQYGCTSPRRPAGSSARGYR